MKIHACSFGIAGAVTATVAYTSLGLLLKFMTSPTLKLIGTVAMMPKLDYISPFIRVTPQAIITGLVSNAIAGFLICWLIATIYNIFQK